MTNAAAAAGDRDELLSLDRVGPCRARPKILPALIHRVFTPWRRTGQVPHDFGITSRKIKNGGIARAVVGVGSVAKTCTGSTYPT